jgi:tetratricopeptide (TPR) repeat protein
MKERLAMLLNFKENYAEAYSLTSDVLQQLETSTSTEELRYVVKDYLFAENYSLHGLAAAGLGKEAEAATAAGKAATYRNDIGSCYYRAKILYIQLNWQKTVNELNSGYAHAMPNERDSPLGIESRFLLGNSYFKIGDMPQAKNAYETFLSANPFEPEAFSNLGLVYAKLGDNRQAISNYSSALKLDSNLLATLVNRGSAYMKDKRYDDAISDFSAVLARQPDNADVLYKRAYSLCASGNEPKAKKDLAAILQIEPGSVRARELLSRCGGI